MKKRLKNSKNKQKDLSTIVVILVVVVIGMSIAYAALSSTLTISMNQVTQNSLSWDVAFQTGTVTGTPGGSSSSTGRSCGNATVTADSVTVADTLLSKPEDSCTYSLVIKNTGSVDAKLGNGILNSIWNLHLSPLKSTPSFNPAPINMIGLLEFSNLLMVSSRVGPCATHICLLFECFLIHQAC